jgi:hypothetical protein
MNTAAWVAIMFAVVMPIIFAAARRRRAGTEDTDAQD